MVRARSFGLAAPTISATQMSSRKKRPRDTNWLAKSIVYIVTGETEDREPTPEEQAKDPAAVRLGRRGGLRGGEVRAASPGARRRKEIAAFSLWIVDAHA
jgi:hypothetical protein